jgi:putative ABC transport system permease protein
MGWIRQLFSRRRVYGELSDEIRAHIEEKAEELVASGMSRNEAAYAARREFGNATRIEEDSREVWRWPSIEDFSTDVRYGLRTLPKSPTFTLTVVLTLAIGIGGNTAMFTLIRAVLLKPLEYRDPDRLVSLSLKDFHENKRDGSFTLKRSEEMRGSSKSFNAIGAFLKLPENISLSGQGEPEALVGARVSANFLDILKVKPLLGRSFLAEEDAPGAPAVAMISASLWRRRFQGDPLAIGKTARLNATPHTIIGVLPENFAFPFVSTDVWFARPAEWSVIPPGARPHVTILNGFARLKPQVSLQQAQAELDVVNRQYVIANPDRLDAGPGVSLQVASLKDQFVANVRPTLWMLFGAVGFVLLIACGNVAGLLLARANFRIREFAVRSALGAARGRLVRQLLVESLVLAVAGGSVGVSLAEGVLYAIRHFGALQLPRVEEIQLDSVVLGFTLVLSIATGILFGLFPSLQASRRDLAAELRESSPGAGHRSSARRRILGMNVRGVLVVGQVSLSIVLLIGATLLIKSFARLSTVDPGFQSPNLLTMKITLPPTRYDTGQTKSAFFGDLVQRLESVPGVRNATVALSLPTTKGWLGTNVLAEGQPIVDGDKQPTARLQSITPGYFRTLGIPLRRGREFTARDNGPDARPVVIINESFAQRFWPTYPFGRDPVRQHIREGIDRTDWMEIVGIVADVHEEGLNADPVPEFYVPSMVHAPQTAYLVVRTKGDPHLFANAVRSQVLAIDRDQPVSDVRTMDEVLEATLGQRRLTTLVLGSFAGVALLLAVVGMYGVLAYSVGQRTQEVGIRRALGAQQADILHLVLIQGLALALAGVGIGVGAAFALTRLMNNLLFRVSATDPATFLTIALLFMIVGLLASVVPAWRALRVDPMVALRYE